MRLHPRHSRRGADRITVNLASMIDISFLLLFYFLASTMFDDRENRLSTALQTQSANAVPMDFQPQNIEVRSSDGVPVYQIGARALRTREELAAALEPLPRDTGVFIKVHDGVPVAFAVAAVQVARDVGFDQVTYVPAR